MASKSTRAQMQPVLLGPSLQVDVVRRLVGVAEHFVTIASCSAWSRVADQMAKQPVVVALRGVADRHEQVAGV